MPVPSPAYTAESFQSIPMSHAAEEVFTPPMVANRRAEAKACKDPVSYRFFQSHPLATAEGSQAQLYLRLPATDSIRPLGDLGVPVTYTWRPDRLVRHLRYGSLDFTSVTRLALRSDALLIDLRLRNSSASASAEPDLYLRLLSGVEKLSNTSVWNTVASPLADTRWDDSRRAFVFSGAGGAVAVQGVDQPVANPRSSVALAEWVSDGDMRLIVSNRVKSPSVYAGFALPLRLPPGSTWRLRFVHVLADDEARALREYDELMRDFDGEAARAEADWAEEIAAAFTPGSGRFSGSLPVLRNVPEPVERAYLAGVSNLLFMKRRPGGILPQVYKTISPRSGPTCWLWDVEQAAPALGLLDPQFLKGIAEAWMLSDIHGGWAINYLTGQMQGTTYSVNDYALFVTAFEYLRFSRDPAWVDSRVGADPVGSHLRRCASGWKERPRDGWIADYGAARHLLECVPTYEHGVASLNAANAWMSRQLVKILDGRLAPADRERLGCEADAITADVLGRLLQQDGTFSCLYPDGRLQPVAHCYDFATVSSALDDVLPAGARDRMVGFFLERLMTPSWMRALAEDDPAAALNFRTDHSAAGAYSSWPASCMRALGRAGRHREIVHWLGVGNPSGGIAGVARQGPYGQGTFHGGPGSLLEGGAARKAPDDPPHYEEWVASAGGAMAWSILEAVFGLEVPLHGPVTVRRAAWDLLPDARVENVVVGGRTYRIRGGVLEEEA